MALFIDDISYGKTSGRRHLSSVKNFITGLLEKALRKIFHGDKSIPDQNRVLNKYPRVGRCRHEDLHEICLDRLIPLHPVPRPEKPVDYIDELVTSIKTSGYQLEQTIPVVQMTDGRLLIAGGHHRVAAMRKLGETTIPARVVQWYAIPPKVRKRYQNRFPRSFSSPSIFKSGLKYSDVMAFS